MTEVCFLGRINQVSLIRKITFPYKTVLWFYKEVEIFFPMYLVRMPLGLFLHQLIYKIDLFSITLWVMKVVYTYYIVQK